MAIPKDITKQNILDAIQYIEKNGIPPHNQSTKYDLMDDSGEKYPPKCIIAVANHLANNTDISVEGFNAVWRLKTFYRGLAS